MFKYPISAQKIFFSIPVFRVQETSLAPVKLRLWDTADTKRRRPKVGGGGRSKGREWGRSST